MLMIRFQRIGRTNDPAFRIVVLEKSAAAKSGSILELLGIGPDGPLGFCDLLVADFLAAGA